MKLQELEGAKKELETKQSEVCLWVGCWPLLLYTQFYIFVSQAVSKRSVPFT